MTSNIKSTAPIQSTAGAVPMKNEKGDISMQKVRVNRYVTGKRPDYAPDSSSGESDDEGFDFKKSKAIVVPKGPGASEASELVEEVTDRRLRRLQERMRSQDSDEEDDRVARHRREVVEPELLGEGTDSEEEKKMKKDVIDSSEEDEEEEEELDEEEIERRRALLRQRALQRKEEDEVMNIEEEKSEGESEEESSEYEEYSDSEEETGPRLKPVFVRKKYRVTIQEKEREEVRQKELEVEAKRILTEERRKQTLKMIEDETRREIEEQRNVKEACDAIESGDENDEEEYEAWKVRELKRLKRDREEKENLEKEKMEIERVRNMTEEERRQEFAQNKKTVTNKAPKGKYKFLQKYYHRGSFFMNDEQNVFTRDFSAPTLEDHFDKTVLPKVMQVKNFGRSGRTKYTHLVDQDTTQFDSPWMADTAQNIKFHTAKGGGMKQVLERPTINKKRK